MLVTVLPFSNSFSALVLLLFSIPLTNLSMMLYSESLPFAYPHHYCYYYCCYQASYSLYLHSPPQLHSLSVPHSTTENDSASQFSSSLHPTINQNMRAKRRSFGKLRSMEFDESKLPVEIRTTIMIKNIPNKLSRDMLLTLLDQHCAEENYKAAAVEGSPLSEYDFIYLPMDFSNKCNMGRAFVNFTNATAGWRFHIAMHGRRWAIFSSNKICNICYARIQGKEALINNFRRSCFFCQDEKYLPAVLSPPRDGATSVTPPAAVGKRICYGR